MTGGGDSWDGQDDRDGWVTFMRVWHGGLKRWVRIEKNDGMTRVVVEAGAGTAAG